MKRLVPVLALVSLAFASFFVGCQPDPEQSSSSPSSADEPAETRVTAKWGYTGKVGPSNWASLDSTYQACAGTSQSPVDLTASAEPTATPNIRLNYTSAPGTLFDTGHGVQVNIEGGTLTIDGKAFALKQFHFHTPSEHTLNGTQYAGEVHLVHAAEDGELAVLGIFIEEGAANRFLEPVWAELGSKSDIQDADPISMNVTEMLPETRVTQTYSGSLTTPPCSETVRWHVMEQPITMSAEQLRTLTELYDGNNRPVQPLNDREIARVTL